MKVYTTDKIRNVVLLGHGGVGKTTIVEAMAYLSGITSRMGRVEDGNTISDYDKEEIKRGFSISTSLVPIELGDVKINILDTPGFFDFVGEVEEAVSAADAAIIVIDGKAGVQVGTNKAWEICEKYNLQTIDIFNDNGTISEAAGMYVGMDRFDVRKQIENDLSFAGLLEKTEAYSNKVGYSERTNVVIEPKLSMQWFLKMEHLAK